MKSLRTLGRSAVLILTFAFAASAQTPSCWTPGQTETPPCSLAQPVTDDPVINGDQNVSSVADAVESAVAEAAIDVLQSVLLVQ